MSIGIVGAISLALLEDFAISRAFHVLKEGRNTGTASCKICGARLTKDQGRPVRIADASAAGLVASAYVCSSCAARVERAVSRVRAAST